MGLPPSSPWPNPPWELHRVPCQARRSAVVLIHDEIAVKDFKKLTGKPTPTTGGFLCVGGTRDFVQSAVADMEASSNHRIIFETAGECIDQFHQCLSQSQLPRHGPASALVEDQYGRFNIWISNIGVFAPAHGFMDYRLREAADIKDLVVRLLETLLGHIEQSESIF